MVRVLFFGRLREAAGRSELEITPTGATIADLICQIERQEPALGEALRSPSVKVALDQQFVRPDGQISGAKEVAFMPPLSGG